MKIDQMDIPINDFMLRIKNDGEWIRLDTGAGMMMEGDDYSLDFSNSSQVQALAILRDIFEEEIKEYIKLTAERKFSEAFKVFDKIKQEKK